MYWVSPALLFCLLFSVQCAVDPYSKKVDYVFLAEVYGKQDAKNCSKHAWEDANCIPTKQPISSVKLPGCKWRPVRDYFGCCYVCSKPEREICGGFYGKMGACQTLHKCAHPIVMQGDFNLKMGSVRNAPTGKCIPLNSRQACSKDCCSRKRSDSPICGTDGKWYLNRCFLYKANCFRSPNAAPEIKQYKGDDPNHCGVRPPDCKDLKIKACDKGEYVFGDPDPVLHYQPKIDVCPSASTVNGTVHPSSTPVVKH